ncbi:DUF1336 domain containing protein expressed, partial [Zea mays]
SVRASPPASVRPPPPRTASTTAGRAEGRGVAIALPLVNNGAADARAHARRRCSQRSEIHLQIKHGIHSLHNIPPLPTAQDNLLNHISKIFLRYAYNEQEPSLKFRAA